VVFKSKIIKKLSGATRLKLTEGNAAFFINRQNGEFLILHGIEKKLEL